MWLYQRNKNRPRFRWYMYTAGRAREKISHDVSHTRAKHGKLRTIHVDQSHRTSLVARTTPLSPPSRADARSTTHAPSHRRFFRKARSGGRHHTHRVAASGWCSTSAVRRFLSDCFGSGAFHKHPSMGHDSPTSSLLRGGDGRGDGGGRPSGTKRAGRRHLSSELRVIREKRDGSEDPRRPLGAW